MILLRKEAIKIAAFIQMFLLSPKQRDFTIESALLEAGVENVSESKEYFYLRDYVEYELKFVKNSYLEKIISDKFEMKVKVEGNQPRLNKCRCCDFKTLQERGHYEICAVCYWEDDGTSDEEDYSPPNRMTLREGKQNFEKIGISDLNFTETKDEERMLKYDK